MTTTSLTVLNSLLLSFAWETNPGLTYSVQTSEDLLTWQTLPYVFDGDLPQHEVSITGPAPVTYVRLQYADDGDSNENGLPDKWEWMHLGTLDANPLDDPDGDGLSTLTEWQTDSDPLDFFNGQRSTIQLLSGLQWMVPAGSLSRQSLSLRVLDETGGPLPNATVKIRCADGSPFLVNEALGHGNGSVELTVQADSMGRIEAPAHAIHFHAPEEAGRYYLVLQHGASEMQFPITVLPSNAPLPPRDVAIKENADGTLTCSWSNAPGEALGLLLEYQMESGAWMRMLDASVNEVNPPQPGGDRYSIIFQP